MNELPLFIPESRKPVVPVAARPLTIKRPPGFMQPEMLDVRPNKPISANGEARNIYGSLCNRIANAMLGLEDIVNSGTHSVVFDSYHRASGTFVEVKSLRRNNKCPIYDFRRTKDREAGVPLAYVIPVHDCKECRSLAELRERMAETLTIVLVLPAWCIDLEARRHPLKKIKTQATASGKQNGYQREGYKNGYRNVPCSALEGHATRGSCVPAAAEVDGTRFAATVHFHPSITPWLPPA